MRFKVHVEMDNKKIIDLIMDSPDLVDTKSVVDSFTQGDWSCNNYLNESIVINISKISLFKVTPL